MCRDGFHHWADVSGLFWFTLTHLPVPSVAKMIKFYFKRIGYIRIKKKDYFFNQFNATDTVGTKP